MKNNFLDAACPSRRSESARDKRRLRGFVSHSGSGPDGRPVRTGRAGCQGGNHKGLAGAPYLLRSETPRRSVVIANEANLARHAGVLRHGDGMDNHSNEDSHNKANKDFKWRMAKELSKLMLGKTV